MSLVSSGTSSSSLALCAKALVPPAIVASATASATAAAAALRRCLFGFRCRIAIPFN